jgi:hypothetical protein
MIPLCLNRNDEKMLGSNKIFSWQTEKLVGFIVKVLGERGLEGLGYVPGTDNKTCLHSGFQNNNGAHTYSCLTAHEADRLPPTNHRVDLYLQFPLRLHDLQLNKTLGQINL